MAVASGRKVFYFQYEICCTVTNKPLTSPNNVQNRSHVLRETWNSFHQLRRQWMALREIFTLDVWCIQFNLLRKASILIVASNWIFDYIQALATNLPSCGGFLSSAIFSFSLNVAQPNPTWDSKCQASHFDRSLWIGSVMLHKFHCN